MDQMHFFVNNNIKEKCNLQSYKPDEIYEECKLRNIWSNSNAILNTIK